MNSHLETTAGMQDPALDTTLDPDKVTFVRNGAEISMTVAGQSSTPDVRLVAPFPFSHPHKSISVLDSAGKEIGTLDDPERLPHDSRVIVEQELYRRHVIPVITAVTSVSNRFGLSEWKVRTDRGPCTFTVKDLSESSVDLPGGRILVTALDDNKFLIDNLHSLDRKSRTLLLQHL